MPSGRALIPPCDLGVAWRVELDVPLSRAVDTMDRAALRGKFAGFTRTSDRRIPFLVQELGSPFSGELIARQIDEEGGRVRLELRARLHRVGSTIFGLVLLATIWPGVILVDSLMQSYFPGSLATRWVWWWYLALTLPTSPWAYLAAVKASTRAVIKDAEEAVKTIEKLTGAAAVKQELRSEGSPA